MLYLCAMTYSNLKLYFLIEKEEFFIHLIFIFLTVLFDTLTNNVSFLFLFLMKHLSKCVALLCIYIIVIIIVLLLIYMWDFNSFMYVFSYE
jgi:hypothetical protein